MIRLSRLWLSLFLFKFKLNFMLNVGERQHWSFDVHLGISSSSSTIPKWRHGWCVLREERSQTSLQFKTGCQDFFRIIFFWEEKKVIKSRKKPKREDLIQMKWKELTTRQTMAGDSCMRKTLNMSFNIEVEEMRYLFVSERSRNDQNKWDKVHNTQNRHVESRKWKKKTFVEY